jgi:branched-chain amino acid transport system ATP-binding protein
MSEILLETVSLSKSFGALAAVSGVSLRFHRGEVHALIGPNGAGKTTFLNLLSGELRPSGGHVYFKGRDITSATPDRISRLGVGRSFQKTTLFPGLSCLESAEVAAQSRLGSSMRFFRPASRLTDVTARAERALAHAGIGHLRDQIASAMSYGEQRQLELALILATEPELLLLDEPLAGLGQEESHRAVALISRLAQDHTLILIEHDMDAVFQVADVLTVMVGGSVLMTGTVDEVRRSRAVQEVYLGEDTAP